MSLMRPGVVAAAARFGRITNTLQTSLQGISGRALLTRAEEVQLESG